MITFLLIVVAILIAIIAYFAWKLTVPKKQDDIKQELKIRKTTAPEMEAAPPVFKSEQRDAVSYEGMMSGSKKKSLNQKSVKLETPPQKFYKVSEATLFAHRALPARMKEELSEEQVELVLRLQTGYDQLDSAKANGNHQDKVEKILKTLHHSKVRVITRGQIEEILKGERQYVERLLA